MIKIIYIFFHIESKYNIEIHLIFMLFCHFDSKPFNRDQFSSVLKHSLAVLGVSGAQFTSHSFRIGMATICAMEGVPDNQIKTLGCWKSGEYLRYIRIPI